METCIELLAVCPTWCPKHTLVKFRKITLMLLADYVFCFGLLINTKPKLTNQLSWPINYSGTGIDVRENFVSLSCTDLWRSDVTAILGAGVV